MLEAALKKNFNRGSASREARVPQGRPRPRGWWWSRTIFAMRRCLRRRAPCRRALDDGTLRAKLKGRRWMPSGGRIAEYAIRSGHHAQRRCRARTAGRRLGYVNHRGVVAGARPEFRQSSGPIPDVSRRFGRLFGCARSDLGNASWGIDL
jgi:hypothetical protein